MAALSLCLCAAALPVQGIAATNPKVEPQPASSSIVSRAVPDPSPSPTMPRPAGTGSKSLSPYAVTPGGTWSWQNPMPDGIWVLAVSCPSTTTCFAGSSDGRVLVTTSGNAPWSPQTTGNSAAINAISCVSATTCVAAGDFGAALRTADGGATWTKVIINSGGYVAGVSCPTASICFAVGAYGAILKSTDGGASWTTQLSPISTYGNLYAIACTTTTNCVAAGPAGTALTTDGSNWTGTPPTSNQQLRGVGCLPTTTTCFAVGYGYAAPSPTPGGLVLLSRDGGSTWQRFGVGTTVVLTGVSCPSSSACYASGDDGSVYVLPFDVHLFPHGWTGASEGLYAISCPTAASCFAVGSFGSIVNTTTGGTAWTQQSGLPNNTLNAISCLNASSMVCFAVGAGGEVAATTNGGTTWSTQTSSTTQNLLAISCLNSTTCFAVGSGGTLIATTTGGTTWSAQTSNTTQTLVSISCPISTTTCFAATNNGSFIKTTDGVNWSSPRNVGFASSLTGISCPSATTCFATNPEQVLLNLIYSTTDGGTTWNVSFNLGNDPQAGVNARFAAIACPTTTTCYAVGASGLVATTSDGGANWRTDTPPSQASLTGVSCVSAATCYVSAQDSTILSTSDFGGTWDVQMGFNPYNAVSCAGTKCFAVGSGGNASATTILAAAWTIQRPAGTTSRIRAMSCASLSDCYAVTSNTILATHNGGTSWAANTLRTTDQLVAISCPAANYCLAVGWPGAIYRTGDGGTTWTLAATSLYGSDNTFLGVSCALAWYCFVVGTQGTILFTNDGNTFVTETSGLAQLLYGVSCPDTYSCVAVGNSGFTMTRSAGSWQANPTATTQNLRGVSCPSEAVCYAVGTGGTVLQTQNRGANWTAQTSGTANALYGVSCPRTTECLAAGNFGTAVLTTDGSSWSAVNTTTGNALRSVVFQDLNHAWVAGFGGTILANPTLTQLCSSVAVSGNPPNGAVVGTQVTFTATSTGCPNAQYEFWLRGIFSTTWQLVQAYSPSATYVWNSTGAQAPVYVGIWARDATSSASADALASIQYSVFPAPPCSSVSVSAAPPSPSAAGTQITFTANASCPNANPLYAFWAKWQGNPNWYPLQGYSTSNTYNWNSTGASAGTEYIGVWVKDAGSTTSTFDANASIPYSVTTATCTVVTVSASPTTVVHGSGTHVTVTAGAMCNGPNPRYEFWLRTTNTDWQLVQPYSPSGTYDWNSTGAPVTTVYIGVWAKEAGSSTSSFDVNQSVAIPVT